MTLAEFLLARLAEDEAQANLADGGWYDPDHEGACDTCEALKAVPNPARALREVEAKRRLIDNALEVAASVDGEWGCGHSAGDIRTETEKCRHTPPPRGVIVNWSWIEGHDDGYERDPIPSYCYGVMDARRLLGPFAAVYADHPDYRPEWALTDDDD